MYGCVCTNLITERATSRKHHNDQIIVTYLPYVTTRDFCSSDESVSDIKSHNLSINCRLVGLLVLFRSIRLKR